MAFLSLVQLNYFLRVDWQPFVWIDYHTKQTRIRLKSKQNNGMSILCREEFDNKVD